MGWCHEFGPMVNPDCGHPMTAGATSCYCDVCGVACTGKFAGCPDVWARGPKEVLVEAPSIAVGRTRRGLTPDVLARADPPAAPAPELKALTLAIEQLDAEMITLQLQQQAMRSEVDELRALILASQEVRAANGHSDDRLEMLRATLAQRIRKTASPSGLTRTEARRNGTGGQPPN